MDLEAYFRRIGYGGPRTPTLSTLRALQFHHATTIPFENLNPLLDRPVPLDLDSLFAKLVASARGGYCFEQNLLFRHVLSSLGFRVSGLIARVMWNRPDDVVTARSHMVLRVELPEGTFITDVGFGGQTSTGPLELVADVAQETPLEPYRLSRAGEYWVLQSLIRGEWRPLYRFTTDEAFVIDYEVANHYTSTHPSSHFRQRLLVARAFADRRCGLMGTEFVVHPRNGDSERRVLQNAAEVRAVLADTFGIDVPLGSDVDAALVRC